MELVKLISGQPQTTSRLIAERFGRQHKSILRAIQNLDCSEDFGRRNFALSSYKTDQGKDSPEYIIKKDGFCFLAMGFTGKTAAKFKEDFITAFNEMERLLRQPPCDDELILRMVSSLQSSLDQFSETIRSQTPKVRFVDDFLSVDGYLPSTVVAKSFGMNVRKLHKILVEKQIAYQYKGIPIFKESAWLLKAPYEYQGLAVQKFKYRHNWGKHTVVPILAGTSTYWTPKGIRFLYELLNNQTLLSA